MHELMRKNVLITLFSYSIMLRGKNVKIEYLVEHNLFEGYFILFIILDGIDGLF